LRLFLLFAQFENEEVRRLTKMGSPTYFRLGTGFTVFLLFFGVATLEAFQTHNWLKAVFWLAIGFVFLLMEKRQEVEQ
jgi:hypothetical protein